MNETSVEKSAEKPASKGVDAAASGSDPLVKCSQCGQLPSDLEDDAQPEIMVLAENFGEPWMYGVRCRICGRVAKGVGRDAAIKRWQDGGHDGDLDDFGNEDDDDQNTEASRGA